MTSGPIRRAQLIAPFGVGAMIVVRDGTSLISCGLDHWYQREDGSSCDDLTQFMFSEWRLQRLLRVDHFRLPPDYRGWNQSHDVPNRFLTVPFLRFPQWHYCTFCGFLTKLPMTMHGRQMCPQCNDKKQNNVLVQVPFVAMCEHGHIQDFPWVEWAHETANPTCGGHLKLVATGGATLSGQRVKCSCGANRSLANITTGPDASGTYLSRHLDCPDRPYLCQGQRPWLGLDQDEPCGLPLKGSLRSAANVYYSQVRSAIYLPISDSSALSDLITLLEGPPFSTVIKLLLQVGQDIDPKTIRGQQPDLLKEFSDEQIAAAIKIMTTKEKAGLSTEISEIEDDDQETSFRRAEFNVLRTERNEEHLRISLASLDEYKEDVNKYFSRVMLVEKLRETRALVGFTRIFSENGRGIDSLKSLMWRSVPEESDVWLPAYIVYGEGIYLELDENRLVQWMKTSGEKIEKRLAPLIKHYSEIQQGRHLKNRPLGPRFVLMHTLAHILMNRLVFECGYGSASLRERLYISDNPKAPMAGMLIYTAAGDSEGTMGGLVRMGKPGYLEPMVRRALEAAQWCSADPVCMEMGNSGGQGPDSCNLAACHNCALVPETACEEFNRFLDRALVVGDMVNPSIGYFKQ